MKCPAFTDIARGFCDWCKGASLGPHPEVTAALAEASQDIYLDLRRGLVLWDQGHTNHALWHWKFLYRLHWGRHAVGAMYALHGLVIAARA